MTDTTLTLPLIDEERHDSEFRERLLLAVAGLFLFVAHTGLIVAQGHGTYWPVAAWFICAVAWHLVLQRRLPRHAPFFFPIVLFLSGWGLPLIEGLAPPFAMRQAIWLLVSIGAMLVIANAPGDMRWLSR